MSNVKEYTKEYLEKNIKPLLKVGASIKIGKHYADEIGGFKPGEIITLIEGHFDYDNGLYTVDQTAPSVWNKDAKEFDSIYHLFGNDLENFFDCEVLTEPPMINNQLPADVQDRIKKDAEALFGYNENRGDGGLVNKGRYYGYIAGATAWVQWKVKYDELVAEVEQLRRWKKEANMLLDPLYEYGRWHPDIKLGESITGFILTRAKERDTLKERCEKMEGANVH